jgi:hypothetical protein
MISYPVATNTPAGPTSASSVVPTDDALREYFERFFFEQADKAIKGGAAYGSFFIMVGCIHYMAALVNGQSVTGIQFKSFVHTYLPTYDPDAMWASLRCGMFHLGVPEDEDDKSKPITSIRVTDGKPRVHAPTGTSPVLNAESLLGDLKRALEAMLSNRASDKTLEAKIRGIYETKRVEVI